MKADPLDNALVEARLEAWYQQSHTSAELTAIRKAWRDGIIQDTFEYVRDSGILPPEPLTWVKEQFDSGSYLVPSWSTATIQSYLESIGISYHQARTSADYWKLLQEHAPPDWTLAPTSRRCWCPARDVLRGDARFFEGLTRIEHGFYAASYGS